MDNFDLKKFLVENKLTANSRLAESSDIPENALRLIEGEFSGYMEYIDQESIDYLQEEDLQSLVFSMTVPPSARVTANQFEREYDNVRSSFGPGGAFYHQMVNTQQLPDGGFTADVYIRTGLDI